jgi:hypothetical protein
MTFRQSKRTHSFECMSENNIFILGIGNVKRNEPNLRGITLIKSFLNATLKMHEQRTSPNFQLDDTYRVYATIFFVQSWPGYLEIFQICFFQARNCFIHVLAGRVATLDVFWQVVSPKPSHCGAVISQMFFNSNVFNLVCTLVAGPF